MPIENPCEACIKYDEEMGRYIDEFMKGDAAASFRNSAKLYERMLDDHKKLDPALVGTMLPICRSCRRISLYDGGKLQEMYRFVRDAVNTAETDPRQFDEFIAELKADFAIAVSMGIAYEGTSMLDSMRSQSNN